MKSQGPELNAARDFYFGGGLQALGLPGVTRQVGWATAYFFKNTVSNLNMTALLILCFRSVNSWHC